MLRQTIALCTILLTFLKILQCKHGVDIVEHIKAENICQDLYMETIPEGIELCEVEYPNFAVVPGKTLQVKDVQDEPKVSWKSDQSTFYTLIMLTPDYRERWFRFYDSWLCWFVGNIPGCDIHKGYVISEYVGPILLPQTGDHRWVFLVYRQPGVMNFSQEPYMDRDPELFRGCFNLDEISDLYNLTGPIALNYFMTWDDFFATKVPQTYSKWKAYRSWATEFEKLASHSLFPYYY